MCSLKMGKRESEVLGIVPADRHCHFNIISSSKLGVHTFVPDQMELLSLYPTYG